MILKGKRVVVTGAGRGIRVFEGTQFRLNTKEESQFRYSIFDGFPSLFLSVMGRWGDLLP